MKNIIIILIGLFAVSNTFAQATISEQYVPAILKDKMKEMYPEAKGVYWKQPMPGFMDSYFTLNKMKCTCTFAVSGAWVSTDIEILETEFPPAAMDYLNNTAKADKISRLYRVETKAKGTQYAADAKVAGDAMQYVFDKDGALIMKGPRD